VGGAGLGGFASHYGSARPPLTILRQLGLSYFAPIQVLHTGKNKKWAVQDLAASPPTTAQLALR